MRILIAEDDESLAKFVRQGLETEQYAVDVVKDGEQALSAALAFDYELVILDLKLPKLDGVGVLRHLRVKKPSLPILILTQRTRVEYLMRHTGRNVTRSMIIEHVWNLTFDTTTNVVDVYINYLRRKIDDGHAVKLIQTVRGVGYALRAPVEVAVSEVQA